MLRSAICLALVAAQTAEARVEPVSGDVVAAFAVVRDYYAAINAHDYRRAYGLWSGGRSFAAMQAGYSHTREVTVSSPLPCAVEGAAGSLYCETMIRVDAVLDDGRRQRFQGSVTVRRVNDVEGATRAERRWHIVKLRLRPVPLA